MKVSWNLLGFPKFLEIDNLCACINHAISTRGYKSLKMNHLTKYKKERRVFVHPKNGIQQFQQWNR